MTTESIARALHTLGDDICDCRPQIKELSDQLAEIHHQLERIADHLEAREAG